MKSINNFSEYLDWLNANEDFFSSKASPKKSLPKHPGYYLNENFLNNKGISQSELARRLGCSHAKINEIINGKRAITAEFALLLEKEFGEPAELWVSLQMHYHLWQVRGNSRSFRSV